MSNPSWVKVSPAESGCFRKDPATVQVSLQRLPPTKQDVILTVTETETGNSQTVRLTAYPARKRRKPLVPISIGKVAGAPIRFVGLILSAMGAILSGAVLNLRRLASNPVSCVGLIAVAACLVCVGPSMCRSFNAFSSAGFTPVTAPTAQSRLGPTLTSTIPQIHIITDYLALRDAPGARDKSIGTLHAGELVTVVGAGKFATDNTLWWKVRRADGGLGWIVNNQQYISLENIQFDINQVPLNIPWLNH